MSSLRAGHADAIVIGAGLIGLAIARELGRRGRTVEVIEAARDEKFFEVCRTSRLTSLAV